MFAAQLHPSHRAPQGKVNKCVDGDRRDTEETDTGLVTVFEKASSMTFIMMNLKLDFYFIFYA